MGKQSERAGKFLSLSIKRKGDRRQHIDKDDVDKAFGRDNAERF